MKSRFIIGLLSAGLAIALVMSVSTFASSASQPNETQRSMMAGNGMQDMMNGMNSMQNSGQNNMGSIMNMMGMMMARSGTMMMGTDNMINEGMKSPMGSMVEDDMVSMMNMMQMMRMMEDTQEMMNQMMGQMMPSEVHMYMDRFFPDETVIESGATMTWWNMDMHVHDVVGIYTTEQGETITIRSPDLSHMDSWSYTFDKVGVFEYFCSYHEAEGMVGRISIS